MAVLHEPTSDVCLKIVHFLTECMLYSGVISTWPTMINFCRVSATIKDLKEMEFYFISHLNILFKIN